MELAKEWTKREGHIFLPPQFLFFCLMPKLGERFIIVLYKTENWKKKLSRRWKQDPIEVCSWQAEFSGFQLTMTNMC
jgi:hypothetical protein